MRITALITDERTFAAKQAGKNDSHTVTMLDMGEHARCSTPLEMFLDDADRDLVGKLRDTKVLVDVTEISAGYKGRISVRGKIVRQADAKSGK